MRHRATSFLSGALILLCCACSAPDYTLMPQHQYVFSLSNPRSETMSFSDDAVFLSFSFSATAVSFLLQNNADRDVAVLWDEANLVQHGIAMKLVPEDSPYANRYGIHPAGRVQPHRKKTFAAIPRENLGARPVSSNGMVYSSAPLFTLNDANLDLMKLRFATSGGPALQLHLPLAVGDSTRDYLFEFTATGIAETVRPKGE